MLSVLPEMSGLRKLRELRLHLRSSLLEQQLLAALQSLPALRLLRLSGCGLDWLPDGGWLEGLTSLDISGNTFGSGLPFAGG